MKILIALLLVFTGILLKAQAPLGINYQGVVRDNGGAAIINQPIGLKFIIHSDSLTGPAVYAETHLPTSDAFGSITAIIGQGTVITGSFAAINWGNGSYFNEVLIDINGGSNYLSMGTSQLMSVPYALHANSAGSVSTNMGLQNFIVKINGIPVTDSSLDFAMIDLNTFMTKTGYVFHTPNYGNVTVNKTDSLGWIYTATDDTISQANVYVSAVHSYYLGRVFRVPNFNTSYGSGSLPIRENEIWYIPLNAVPVLLPVSFVHNNYPPPSTGHSYSTILNAYYYQAFPNNPAVTGVDLPHEFLVQYSRH